MRVRGAGGGSCGCAGAQFWGCAGLGARDFADDISLAQSAQVIEVCDLCVKFGGRVLLEHISFTLARGQIVVLLGESGSGKTLCAQSLLGVLADNLAESSGEVRINGAPIGINSVDSSVLDSGAESKNVKSKSAGLNVILEKIDSAKLDSFDLDSSADSAALCALFANARHHLLATILQNPKTCFNPLWRIKSHFFESAKALGESALLVAFASDLDLAKSTSDTPKNPQIFGAKIDSKRFFLPFARERKTRLESLFVLLLARVGLERGVLDMYPFELSGGMLQRVMIALAELARAPFLVADEPTTDLDNANREKVLRLILEARERRGLGVLFITHDLEVAARIADVVHVIENGRIAASFTRAQLEKSARLARRQNAPKSSAQNLAESSLSASALALINALYLRFAKLAGDNAESNTLAESTKIAESKNSALRADSQSDFGTDFRVDSEANCKQNFKNPDSAPQDSSLTSPAHQTATPLLSLRDVGFSYGSRGSRAWLGRARAKPLLHGINLEIFPGEVVGIVGESGCGKSTLARLIAGLARPDTGCVRFCGAPLQVASTKQRRALYKELQILFQDPISSLNPRLRVWESLQEPLANLLGVRDKGAQFAMIAPIFEFLGLPLEMLESYPGMLSGGQAQRVCVAKIMLIEPKLLILDESTSSFDELLKRKVLRLLCAASNALDSGVFGTSSIFDISGTFGICALDAESKKLDFKSLDSKTPESSNADFKILPSKSLDSSLDGFDTKSKGLESRIFNSSGADSGAFDANAFDADLMLESSAPNAKNASKLRYTPPQSVIFITHDLDIAREFCTRIITHTPQCLQEASSTNGQK
ncbi:hypothetical protein BKN38_01450 [Helicobacter sp. CLO-3]|uniref:ABC transporter ATP-binding protein n=1 Tax=unclassified Helicobacter TaxID=2593540 RepID=UPI000804BD25|nr:MULTISPECIES: ATP-binding cassette domain-containing protein [unclassified Helicobacter]OBV29774.1 hypothetical protein BA723_00255 [Helicobacter sp. CLO-3]OHU85227.1 hypothetical protein BKN38_01450 [Helicobacter sp. CLO-3]